MKNKKKSYNLEKDNNSEEIRIDDYQIAISMFLYAMLVVITFFENKLSHSYIKTNKALFGLGFIYIFYLVFLSFYGINFLVLLYFEWVI
ncbi:MAG: hypothetical protein NTW25_07935 [Candidatus Kapabacteria bacterium]|nr:hypothetical protein [Candidatus Kapabacteria bacterium]